MMTAQSLAALLNGREYGEEIDRAEESDAKAAGLVAVFGYSDDNLEFRGAIREEIGAYEGATAVLYRGQRGFYAVPDDREYIQEIDSDEDMVAALTARSAGQKVEAVWAPKEPDATWLIKTSLPHFPFDIMEDSEVFCRGLVLSISDLK